MLTSIIHKAKEHCQTHVHIAPLVSFRILFGLIMLVSIIRFYLKGWIESIYIQPELHFKYYGFEWIKDFDATGMYLLFGTMAISCLFVALGFLYRLSSITFFLTFTYIELIDKTTYLNHYYFVSIMGFLLIFLPAHRYFSLDIFFKITEKFTHVPQWTISSIKLQLGIVYVFAGIAKIHPEWLLDAMPLKIWLPANSHLPLIGWLFKYVWIHYAFSWMGMFYDLTIPFVLLNKKWRPWGYVDFVNGKVSNTLPETSYIPGLASVDLREVLPEKVSKVLRKGFKVFGKKMKGYYTNDAQVVGVESRTSSPVKIPRDKETCEHPQIRGLYPCGEGAGYAGGIVSAAMDGIRCAINVKQKA